MDSLSKYRHYFQVPQSAPKLSANELERVTEVFKMYETGLREATIYPKVSGFLIDDRDLRGRPQYVEAFFPASFRPVVAI